MSDILPPRFITVKQDDDGQRLDRWLRKSVPELSYVLAQKLLRKGQIRINGKRVKPDTRIEAGQKVKIPPSAFQRQDGKPSRIPFKPKITDKDRAFMRSLVIYEDEDIIALNKPYNLAVQGGTNTKYHIDGMLEVFKNKEGVVPRLVHRLDKDTSGILLLARSAKVARALGENFKRHDIRKIYWAVVSPVPEVFEGTIKAPILKSGGDYEKMEINEEEGKIAVTEYVVIENAGREAAFIAFWPRTGRTHQIRVHAAKVLGCGVLGDRKYRATKDEESKRIEADLVGMDIVKRLHLHAHRLILPHPIKSGHMLDIVAPLPVDLVRSWKALGFNHKYKQDPFEELD
ncbi:MAG: RluA family pseudouridine synthase [Alphaproteobacteria bacterium]|nr:RluA family pseudouridine synthase [Alphaproteobacteria bacterium]